MGDPSKVVIQGILCSMVQCDPPGIHGLVEVKNSTYRLHSLVEVVPREHGGYRESLFLLFLSYELKYLSSDVKGWPNIKQAVVGNIQEQQARIENRSELVK